MRDLSAFVGSLRWFGDPVGGSIDADEARDAARDIVSGEAYRVPDRSVIESVLDWILDRLGDGVDTVTPSNGGGPSSLGGVATAIVIVAIAAGLIWMALRLRVPQTETEDDDDVVYGTETRREVAVWAAEAKRLAAALDWVGAIRCWHQAAVAGLITEQVVDDVAGRTSGEYRRLVEERLPIATDAMGGLTDRFEAVWYGGLGADAADEATARRDAELVLDHAAKAPVR